MIYFFIVYFLIALAAAAPIAEQIVLKPSGYSGTYDLESCTWIRPFFSPGELRMACGVHGQPSYQTLFGNKFKVETDKKLTVVIPYFQTSGGKDGRIGFRITMSPVKKDREVKLDCRAETESSYDIVQSSFNLTAGTAKYDPNFQMKLDWNLWKNVKCTFKNFYP